VQGQQNATHAYEGQLSDAQQAFQRALAGVNTDQSRLISDLYPDYLAQAPAASATAKPAATAASTTAAAAVAEAARKARVKKAQDHLRQDKINAAKKKAAPPKKRKTTPGGKSMTIGSSGGTI
jgi:hypothetical protein